VNRTISLAVIGALLTGCGAGGAGTTPLPAQAASGAQSTGRSPLYSRALPGACTVIIGELGCYVQINLAFLPVSDPNAATIHGFTATDLRSAYGLPPAGTAPATGPLIAIVAAYDDPSAESDLAVYRNRFGLPPCTSANGCFTKVTPPGNSTRFNGSWAEEISLDLAMASAACPTCRLALIEAQNGNPNVLSMAVDTAAALRPAAISNSYGIPDGSASPNLDSHYDHPGIAVVASTGDNGTVQFPSSSAHVTAVGGTILTHDASARGWHESVWDKSGAGCSASIAAPAWQTGTGCSTRSVPDVSFVAGLNPGIAVYDSNDGGWIVLGGTSAGSPFVAGLYAQAQDFGANAGGAPSIYAHLASLNAVDPFGQSSTPGTPNGFGAF
jgi:subtilase family serine protease